MDDGVVVAVVACSGVYAVTLNAPRLGAKRRLINNRKLRECLLNWVT